MYVKVKFCALFAAFYRRYSMVVIRARRAIDNRPHKNKNPNSNVVISIARALTAWLK